MKITFKNTSNKTTTINVNPNDTLEFVVPKLMEQNSVDPTKNYIRFIFKSKLLTNTLAFTEFKDEPKIVIIYMVSTI